MNQPTKFLSVIVPVYNEQDYITKILTMILKNLPKNSEIIIVNDGSTDNTANILKKFQPKNRIKFLSFNKNQGKGKAIRYGFKQAQGKIILIQDADLEYNPKYYPKLLAPITNNKTQVVYGSRLGHLKLNINTILTITLPTHFVANKLLSWFTNKLYGSSLTDMETCYKVFTTKVYHQLKLTKKGFDIEAEITAQILKLGFDIIEVPITTKPRTYLEGKKLTWSDGFTTLYTLLSYRFKNFQ